jgi:hypothetical protein
MAGVCGLLVFEFGIFEGLLVVLFGHGLIQFVFLKRLGKSNKLIIKQFVASFQGEEIREQIESEDLLTEDQIPVLIKWIKAINTKDLNMIDKLYLKESVLTPSFSTRIRFDKDQIVNYYRDLFAKDNLLVKKLDLHMQKVDNLKIDSGHIGMGWTESGMEETHVLRFSMVVNHGNILAHHSSLLPTGDVSIALWAENQEKDKSDFIF